MIKIHINSLFTLTKLGGGPPKGWTPWPEKQWGPGGNRCLLFPALNHCTAAAQPCFIQRPLPITDSRHAGYNPHVSERSFKLKQLILSQRKKQIGTVWSGNCQQQSNITCIKSETTQKQWLPTDSWTWTKLDWTSSLKQSSNRSVWCSEKYAL